MYWNWRLTVIPNKLSCYSLATSTNNKERCFLCLWCITTLVLCCVKIPFNFLNSSSIGESGNEGRETRPILSLILKYFVYYILVRPSSFRAKNVTYRIFLERLHALFTSVLCPDCRITRMSHLTWVQIIICWFFKSQLLTRNVWR